MVTSFLRGCRQTFTTSMKNVSAQGGGKQKRKKSQGYSGYRATVMTNKNTLSFVLKRRHPLFLFCPFRRKKRAASGWMSEQRSAAPLVSENEQCKSLAHPSEEAHVLLWALSCSLSLSLWALLRLQLYTASLNNIQNDEWHGQPRIHHHFLFLRSIHLQ